MSTVTSTCSTTMFLVTNERRYRQLVAGIHGENFTELQCGKDIASNNSQIRNRLLYGNYKRPYVPLFDKDGNEIKITEKSGQDMNFLNEYDKLYAQDDKHYSSIYSKEGKPYHAFGANSELEYYPTASKCEMVQEYLKENVPLFDELGNPLILEDIDEYHELFNDSGEKIFDRFEQEPQNIFDFFEELREILPDGEAVEFTETWSEGFNTGGSVSVFGKERGYTASLASRGDTFKRNLSKPFLTFYEIKKIAIESDKYLLHTVDGMTEIVKNQNNPAVRDDAHAVEFAHKDGIPTIAAELLPRKFPYRYDGWLDTQENRDYIKEHWGVL